MSKIALIVRADLTMERIDVADNFLSKMQSAVDGLIQPVDVTPYLTMWVNEEGLLRSDFVLNVYATAVYRQMFETQGVILGDVVFTGGTNDEGDTLGLTEHAVSSLATRVARFKEVVESQMV